MLEEDGGDFTKYLPVQTVDLNPAINTFTFTFTMTEASDPQARVTFNMGGFGEVGGGFAFVPGIDNVVLREVNSSNPELVSNGDFSADNANWQTYIDGAANASINMDGAFQRAEVSIGQAGFHSWHIQLRQAGINIEQGKTYEVSFDATTLGETTSAFFDVIVEEDGSDFTSYMTPEPVTINTAEQQFSFTFTMNEASDSNARVTFNMGLNPSLGGGVNTVFAIDNVSVIEM